MRNKTLATILVSAFFSTSALADIDLANTPLEPSDAYFEAQDLALRQIGSSNYHNLQVSVASGYKGKFRVGDFGQYFFHFVGQIEAEDYIKTAECNVSITVRKLPFAKQPHYILDQVGTEYQVIGMVGDVSCKGLE